MYHLTNIGEKSKRTELPIFCGRLLRMKFFLHTQIGIEKIAELELATKYKGKYSIDYVGYVPHKNGVIQLEWNDESCLDFYKNLGTVEDAYYVLDYVSDLDERFDLKSIYKKIEVKDLKSNLDFFYDKLNEFGPSKEVRFVTRKKAANDFRRIDLENAIKDFFGKNVPRAEVTDTEGVKEIWTTLVKNRMIIGIRLTTPQMRHKEYKTATIPGSLRPTVAYAMAYVSDLRSKETVWDPFCGAGTIGCELVEHFNFKRLLMSDISNDSLEASRENMGNLKSYQKNKGKISFRHEDFFTSPNYADLIITNLPFGNIYQIDKDFITKIFQHVTENQKIGRLVLLFPEIVEMAEWQLTRKFPVQVLGYPSNILVYRRRMSGNPA